MSKPNSFSQGFDLGYEIWTGGTADGYVRITYIDNNTDTQHMLVPIPQFSYKTIVEMQLDIVELDCGKRATRDEGMAYDKRICQCQLQMTNDEMTAFKTAFVTDANARGRSVTIDMAASSGFYPFGPDKGDTGPFDVDLRFEARGIGKDPYKYFIVNLTLVNLGDYPAYSLPAADAKGKLLFIDTGAPPIITNMRYPDDWFQPEQKYAVNSTITHGSDAYYSNRGVGGDSYITNCTFRMNHKKASRFVKSLTNNVRAGLLYMLPYADYYPFGIDKTTTLTTTMQLLSGTLEITHVNYNDWRMPVTFGWIA